MTAITAFKTLVGCISYCIIIGDTATALAARAAAPALLQRRDVLLSIVGAGFLFPLSMLRDSVLGGAARLPRIGLFGPACITCMHALQCSTMHLPRLLACVEDCAAAAGAAEPEGCRARCEASDAAPHGPNGHLWRGSARHHGLLS